MDLAAQVDKLLEIQDLLGIAVVDHPEDYNLEQANRLLIEVLEEVE